MENAAKTSSMGRYLGIGTIAGILMGGAVILSPMGREPINLLESSLHHIEKEKSNPTYQVLKDIAKTPKDFPSYGELDQIINDAENSRAKTFMAGFTLAGFLCGLMTYTAYACRKN